MRSGSILSCFVEALFLAFGSAHGLCHARGMARHPFALQIFGSEVM